MRKPAVIEVIHRSPSGLFTKRGWADELDGQEPSATDPDWASAETELAFASWVHGQAKMLASRLDQLIHSGAATSLEPQVNVVVDALWADAEWARRQIDGSLSEAAE